jgi:hypothetical protein
LLPRKNGRCAKSDQGNGNNKSLFHF